MKFIFGAAALCSIISAPVFAQSQAQQDRIDKVAQLVVTAPICQRLGMTVDPAIGTKVEAAFQAETATWQVAPAIVDALKLASLRRQNAMLRVDLDTASSNARTDEQLRGLRAIVMGYGRTCMEAIRDPIFSQVITVPAGYDLNNAVTAFSDSMLEAGGLASWQTPAIQARGDMMMLAGTCRAQIGAARSDALVSQFGQTDDARVRGYYRRSFDEGLADTDLNFTLAQCNRAITNQRNDIAAAGR
ncbi:hypothetical protein [Sphingobium sp. CR28]|uniref:hypothetical protein n=1 Tax=Sphingobium sp. CR28 TaxID=3400272 RepID=UPI003FF0530E